MSKNFEVIERVGISTESFTEAVKSAVAEANEEKAVYWFEVSEQRGRMTPDGKIEFQATVKMGRKLK